MTASDLDRLRSVFADLTALHDWSGFQTPRNMAMALTAHVGAVCGHLQFTPDTQLGADVLTPALRDDLADCLVYLLALSDAVGIDVADAAVNRVSAAVAKDRAEMTPLRPS